MKWVYGNYEFENRISNLSWTVAGDYNDDIQISKNEYSSKDIALYFATMAGGRHKYIDWILVKRYLLSRAKMGYDIDVISDLLHITLDRLVEEKIIKERPGIEDIRLSAYKDILSGFSKIHNEEILQKIKYFLVLERMGKHPTIDGLSRRIVNKINEINLNENIVEILRGIDEIYINYFNDTSNKYDNENYENERIINSNIDFDTFSDFMYEELYDNEYSKTIENQISEISSSMLIESLGEVDIKGSKHSSNNVLYVDEETLNKIYKKIEHYYGKSYIGDLELKKIESKCCRGVHEGCRVHFTDGVLRSECSNIAQIKYATRQKENNTRKFRENIKIYKRNILKLKETLLRILIEENEKSRVYCDSGTIYANRAWRATRSNNNKIFYKDIENEKGRYVIDILLDSSGSQTRNQANVAIQAYIISTALTKAGIPNRVMGFSSLMDYTILKRFRDYEDKITNNENIFEYFCAGNNRDGLAIKSICEGLLEREEENKILIVLSDGRPNDIKIGKDRERSIRGEMSYKGMIGAKDTASEVRKARQNGIMVLGVFTGKEIDLEVEKIIYGKDFIYTKDIQRFSDVVSMYLKKIIRN
ncbi:nitric oxide reductase activation-like protein [Romboutsia hominis]|uniref:nitric oxide reductase activation-like protein n=1 Tax=Romboutsia hominis TaxID=1507512 RepID=UPI001F05AD53|nr:nitric oxide reductase activation-like protein [Romboutsia hominis]MCH1959099.1 nitric oxide reductase activation-like protein [Romboutsia hominis]MCH1968219.1 nitric oxide reductase activation-like protein [Romboutsia hominis]